LIKEILRVSKNEILIFCRNNFKKYLKINNFLLEIYFWFVNLKSETVTGGYQIATKVPCQVLGRAFN